MFFRVKGTAQRQYLQIAESFREGRRVRQRVIATLGRLDVLRASGQLDRLLRSGLRFSEKIRVLDAHAAGETEVVGLIRIGPDLVFGRLWKSLGLQEIVGGLAAGRSMSLILSGRFISRFCTGSLPRAVIGRRKAGSGTTASPARKSFGCTSLPGDGVAGREIGPGLMGSPRCTKDLIEEALFDRGRELV